MSSVLAWFETGCFVDVFQAIDANAAYKQLGIEPTRADFICSSQYPSVTAKKNATQPKKRHKKQTENEVDGEEYHSSLIPHIESALQQLRAVMLPIKNDIEPRSIDKRDSCLKWSDYVQKDGRVELIAPLYLVNSESFSGPLDLVERLVVVNSDKPLEIRVRLPSQAFNQKIDDVIYYLPSRTSFLISDIYSAPTLFPVAFGHDAWDLIVIDPPWESRSASRRQSYDALPNFDMYRLPMASLVLTSSPTVLVAVWVTNRPRFINFVAQQLFPAWGLQHVATWYWIKVTSGLDPVLPLCHSAARRTYEHLIIGQPEGQSPIVPSFLYVCTMPPKAHSRKPVLLDVFAPYLPQQPKCLELFARQLNPGFSSWGNEPLLFQEQQHFTPL